METIKILGQSNPITTQNTILYTVPIDKGCVISHLNILNIGLNTEYYNLAVINGFLPESGVPLKSYIEYEKSLNSHTSEIKLKGVTLAQGDTIIVNVGSEAGEIPSNLSFNLFGSEFDQTYDYDETLPYGYDYGYGY